MYFINSWTCEIFVRIFIAYKFAVQRRRYNAVIVAENIKKKQQRYSKVKSIFVFVWFLQVFIFAKANWQKR